MREEVVQILQYNFWAKKRRIAGRKAKKKKSYTKTRSNIFILEEWILTQKLNSTRIKVEGKLEILEEE